MKRLMMMLLALCAVFASKAAFIDWQYAANADQNGYNVYLVLGDSAKTDWASVSDLSAASIDSATVASLGRGSYGVKKRNASGVEKADSFYLVVVDAAGEKFGVTDVVAAANLVYNPDAQESAPGYHGQTIVSDLSNSFGGNPPPGPTPGDTPEPTSGLLLLVGGAALALRRKQK